MSDSNEAMSDSSQYKRCALYCESNCGPFRRFQPAKCGVVSVNDLVSDTTGHFKNLKFKDCLETLKWSERRLIENRAGTDLDDSSVICEFHRNTLGMNWKQPKQCLHPSHPPLERGKKSCTTRLAPMWIVDQLNTEIPFSFPLGGRLCTKHRKLELQRRKIDAEVPSDEADHMDQLDQSFVTEEVFVPDDTQQSALSTGRDLTEMLSISPVQFQITKTPVRQLAPSTLRTMKRKLIQVQEESVRCFAESMAPSQSKELLAALEDVSEDENEYHVPVDLAPLVPIYHNSGPQEKTIILSLIDHTRHTKQTIIEAFSCNKHDVDKARKLRACSNGLVIPKREPLRRNKMNTFKMEHFIEFVFSSGLIQDVAYGVTKLKFDSGDEQTIPHAVLTAKYSHVIAFYLQFCKDMGYDALSESSLWRILRALKPSQRRNLGGLDDITAAGMTGFSKIIDFLSPLISHKELISKLERGKRYLKTAYQAHCSINSPIPTHNSMFALSTVKEEPCLGITDEVCGDCYSLTSALDECLVIAGNEGGEDEKYDVNRWVNDIIKYWQHQIRDYQQRQAKADCIQQLDSETAYQVS